MVVTLAVPAGRPAAARYDFAPEHETTNRHGIFAALTQIGILQAASGFLRQCYENCRGRLAAPVLALAAAILLIKQIAAGLAVAAVTKEYDSAWRRFSAGQWTPDMEHYVHPVRERAQLARDLFKK